MSYLTLYDSVAIPPLLFSSRSKSRLTRSIDLIYLLLLSMYFHYAILLLFRPFYNTGVGDSVTITRVVCNEATDNILTLVRTYKNIYTLRRTPAFLPYLVLTAELGRMADHRTGDHRNEIYHTAGLRYLKELASAHPFAIRAIGICRYFRRGWRIEASPEDERDLPEDDEEEGDGVSMSHEVTFFRPDVDLERHHEGVPPHEPMRDHERNTKAKRFVLFPLQGTCEGTMNLDE